MRRFVLFMLISFLAATGCAMEQQPLDEKPGDVWTVGDLVLTENAPLAPQPIAVPDLPIQALPQRQSPWLRYRYNGRPTLCWALTIWVEDHPWLDREAIMAGASYWGVEGLRFSFTEDSTRADIAVLASENWLCTADEATLAITGPGGSVARLGVINVTECGAHLLEESRLWYADTIAHEVGHALRIKHIPRSCGEYDPRREEPTCGGLALMNHGVFSEIHFVTHLDHQAFWEERALNEGTLPLFVTPTSCD